MGLVGFWGNFFVAFGWGLWGDFGWGVVVLRICGCGVSCFEFCVVSS